MRAAPIHRPFLLALAVAIAAAVAPASAQAVFGPIELISKSHLEQAAVAAEPTMSADGRFVAFCAELGGHAGIFREELATGALAPVSLEPVKGSPCEPGRASAHAPSLSADGRYVSFTTDAPLVPADTEPETADVYVADMATSPPTYQLVSAAAGSAQPLPGGSLAAGRVAISADGERVAFVNAGNVYVRDLAHHETILVSAAREALTGEMDQAKPVEGGGAYEPAGAAISADGSTVAWVGEHLAEQVPLPPAEEGPIRTLEGESKAYHEPLWRRVPTSAVPAPPTRRIVGGDRGPYPEGGFDRKFETVAASGFGWGIQLPQLDADGDTVALAGNPEEQYDLFIVSIGEGSVEGPDVHQVTKWTNPNPSDVSTGFFANQTYWPFTGEIADFTISPDGTHVAFTTTRQHFSTPPYTLITELPSALGLLSEVYELDLGSDKIERVTPGPGKDVSTAKGPSVGALSPSFGAGDRLLAFASGAENLVESDANETSDVFTVESDPPAPVGSSKISPRPPQPTVVPAWRMTVNAYSRPDGSVRVVASVPGGGTLRATARSQLGTRLKTHRVATGRRRIAAAGTLAFDLSLARRRHLLARKPGLVTRLRIGFTGAGGRPFHADLQARFLVHRGKKGRGGSRKGAS